ncbi:MAG: hypothetical protein J0H98_01585 [Solirubrobacterales bacterium]|nr:hypothetical protein [Solirubrobacterales bacterium]
MSCTGTVGVDREAHAEGALKYTLKCDEDVKGYSIVSNRDIGYFGTEVIVLGADGEVAEGESFTCEGSIPSFGVGCFGKMTANNTVEGNIGTLDDLCEANVQPKFWATALTTPLVKEVATPQSSEPFLLSSKPCKVLNPKKKAKAKAQKLCAKVKSADSKRARTAARKRCKAALSAVKRLHAA